MLQSSFYLHHTRLSELRIRRSCHLTHQARSSSTTDPIALTLLPNEAVTRICEFLHTQHDLYNLIRTSRLFFFIADQFLYTSVAISDASFPNAFLEAFETKPVGYSWIRSITLNYTQDYLSDSCRANERTIASTLYEFPNLGRLHLTPPYYMWTEALQAEGTEHDLCPAEIDEVYCVLQENTINKIPKDRVLNSLHTCTLHFDKQNRKTT